jgi:hypothetical protein
MLTRRIRVLSVLCLLCCLTVVGLTSASGAPARFDPKDFHARGVFELVIKDAKPLIAGASRIRSRSAFASRVHGLIPGNADGIEVVFVTRPITEASMPDILQHDARQLRTGDYAALVLFLDREHRLAQVNLSYVVPGTTVARTVAWKPDELRKQFARMNVRGDRVLLTSKGTYSEVEAGHEALTLSWDVDVDLPLIREVTR